jgi:hypothetical protein
MRRRRLAHYLICPVLLLTITSGCQVLHSYRPVPVLARDAETKQPISEVDIRLTYPLARNASAPWESSATTGADGIARLQAAPYGLAGVILEATASGYLPEGIHVSSETIEEIPRAHWFEATSRRPPCLVLEMYAGPRPAVELVVPNGYRGLVKVEITVPDDAPSTPGQRNFSYTVPPSGILQVAGATVLRRLIPAGFHARYANGIALDGTAKDGDIGFWWVKSEGGWEHFLVGTRSEYLELHPSLPQPTTGDRAAPAEKGRGHGRRGRGGDSS